MVWRCLLLCSALVGATGCPTVQGPGYLHPGSAQYQQAQAQRFDPYPATDVGPEMSARPLAYMRPAPENERVQNVDSFIKRYRQPPPIERYRPPRSSVAQPPVPLIPTTIGQDSAPLFVP
jgi:hypothetical protein